MQKVRAKKALGQHFLTDLTVSRRISDTLYVPKHPEYDALPVLEVGPGMGVLTQFLMERPTPLKVVEIDVESVVWLRAHYPDLDILGEDFLKMDLDRVFPEQFALIGNYPYNISSQIFFKLLEYKEKIPLCTGMLQREVAQRICAAPGSKIYGILSVLLQAWYHCEYIFTVDEGVFSPPPKVKSGVIRLVRNDVASLDCDEVLFKQIVKTTFGQRRKMLRSTVASFVGKESTVLRHPMMQMRPEQLSVQQFIELTKLVQEARDGQ